MEFLVILLILLAGNWFLSNILVFFPISMVSFLSSLVFPSLIFCLLLFLAWCFDEL